MAQLMAPYDIFRDQLAIRFPAHGHALWEPSPGDLYHVTGVGDVGYISRGRFHRLFNILLPADDPSHASFGVPDNHTPFHPRVPTHIISGILRQVDFFSASVTRREPVGSGYQASRPNDPGEVIFSCREKQGAVLSIPIRAKREDTVVREGFGKWMIKHIDQWFAWIKDKELEVKQMEDIILVTGTDHTRSWANIAFLGGQADAGVSFGVEVTHSKINWKFSPERNTGAEWHWGPSGENLPEDQCIFIRGFRVRKRMIWWPKKLRAAAGPNPDPKGDHSEPDAEPIPIPAIPKYRDPLHVILEYIAEGRPGCDIAIVHDDDLARLDLLSDGASLEALQPEIVLNCLRSSKLAIHEDVFDPDLSSDNNTGTADPEVVKVASLSATFEEEPSRIFDSESGRVTTMGFLQSRVSLITSTTDTMSMMSWLPGPSASTNTLLQVPPTAASSTTLESIFGAALRSYEKQTKCDIASHPLSTQIHFCDTPGAIIAVLRSQVQLSYQSQSASEKWTKWLVPIVHVLYAYSAALGNGEGLIFPPSIAIFTGIGILLRAIRNVRAGRDELLGLLGLFDHIENLFQRLVAYTGVRPTSAMMDGIMKIMIDVLLILGIVTKEAGQGRTRKFVKKLVGKNDVEDALQRLDKLTQEVAWLAETEGQEVLTVTCRYDDETEVVLTIPDSFNTEWGREFWKDSSDSRSNPHTLELRPTADGPTPLIIHHSSRFPEGTAGIICRRVRFLFETCKNCFYFANDEERHRRMRACVEAAASLICCTDFQLDWFGEVGKLVSEIGRIENINEPTTSDQSFIIRWTCLSLVSVQQVLGNHRLQVLAGYAVSGLARFQSEYGRPEYGQPDETGWRSAQRIEDRLRMAWRPVEELRQAFDPWTQQRSKEQIQEILRNHEQQISELEHIEVEADGMEDVDWRISLYQEAMDDATHGLTRLLPGVSFDEPRRSESFLISDTFNIFPTSGAPVAPQFIFPRQQVRALSRLGSKLREVLYGQAADWHKEVLDSLKSVDQVPLSLRRPNGLMERQLWRLQDLRDGSGLGFTIELFLLSLRKLLSIPALHESNSVFYVGAFKVITSHWEESKDSPGTQSILLDILCDLMIKSRGIFSDFSYPEVITSMLVDMVGNMLQGYTGPDEHIREAVREIENVDLSICMDVKLRRLAWEALPRFPSATQVSEDIRASTLESLFASLSSGRSASSL